MTAFEWIAISTVALAAMMLTHYLYRTTVDTLRLDALQTYQWKIMCIDGQFAVLEGTPVRQIGVQKPTVREAIDAALVEREVQRGNN